MWGTDVLQETTTSLYCCWGLIHKLFLAFTHFLCVLVWFLLNNLMSWFLFFWLCSPQSRTCTGRVVHVLIWKTFEAVLFPQDLHVHSAYSTWILCIRRRGCQAFVQTWRECWGWSLTWLSDSSCMSAASFFFMQAASFCFLFNYSLLCLYNLITELALG